jgi:hybrid cluster-associated redox disulfide protein
MQITIGYQTPIQQLITAYPQVIDMLVKDYGFHCMNCLLSEFETLGDGARVHGIVGEEFDEMLADLKKLIAPSPEPQLST